jgi:acyl-CoA dehydrogenase
MIKVAAPRTALRVLDHAMQAHGAGGLSDDFGLAEAYAGMRALRIADGPDEVHLRSIARIELRRHGERMKAWRGQ